MSELQKICNEIKPDMLKSLSDIHLVPNMPLFGRVNGVVESFNKLVISEDQIKRIILETSTPKARAIFGRQKQVTYATNVDSLGRLRFSLFVDKGKFALSARFIRDHIPSLEELGFREKTIKIFSSRGGLILVGSPTGEGKTSTIAAILNFINNNLERSIFTVENPVEYVFKDDRSSFIQRSIPVDISNFYNGLCEAYRIAPDVVVTDSIAYADAMNQAFALCESGCLVIASTEGGDCQQILERFINSREPEERDTIRAKLSARLKLIISQRLVVVGKNTPRIPIFDVLISDVQIRPLLRAGNFGMLRSLQQKNEMSNLGMRTFDSQLAALLKSKTIQAKTAQDYSIARQEGPGLQKS